MVFTRERFTGMYSARISIGVADSKGQIISLENQVTILTGIRKGLESLGKLGWAVTSVEATFTENGDGFGMVVYFRDALGRNETYGTSYRYIGRRHKIPSEEELAYVFTSSDGVKQFLRRFLEKALGDIPSTVEKIQQQISPNE